MKQKINKISILPHTNRVRIYYEDTDSGGVVYHANYLKFAERSRTEMLRKLKIEQKKLLLNYNILFIVKNLNIEYNKPAVLDDILSIESSILKLSAAKIIMKQVMYKKNELITKIDVTLGSVNAMGKPTRIPLKVLNKLKLEVN